MPYAGYPEEDSTKAHFLAGIYFMYIGKDARGEPIWVHRRMYMHWVPHPHSLSCT